MKSGERKCKMKVFYTILKIINREHFESLMVSRNKAVIAMKIEEMT